MLLWQALMWDYTVASDLPFTAIIYSTSSHARRPSLPHGAPQCMWDNKQAFWGQHCQHWELENVLHIQLDVCPWSLFCPCTYNVTLCTVLSSTAYQLVISMTRVWPNLHTASVGLALIRLEFPLKCWTRVSTYLPINSLELDFHYTPKKVNDEIKVEAFKPVPLSCTKNFLEKGLVWHSRCSMASILK